MCIRDSNQPAYLSLADALLELKLFQPASIVCRQALTVAPGNQEISHRLAVALRAEGQLESARDVLQSLCDADSRDSGSRFLLAEMCIRDSPWTSPMMRSSEACSAARLWRYQSSAFWRGNANRLLMRNL